MRTLLFLLAIFAVTDWHARAGAKLSMVRAI